MLKGPKEIFCHAIASALDEYFVVDAQRIQANLFTNTQIVLKDVLLRKQVQQLPNNNNDTVVIVTGRVEEVAFTWSWSMGSSSSRRPKAEKHPTQENNNAESSSWVKDANLTIQGLKFKAQLMMGTANEAELATATSSTSSSSSSYVDEAAAANELPVGGIRAYIQKQVQMIIDSLTLHVVDFELTIEMTMPAPQVPSLSSSTVQDDNDESSRQQTMSIVVGGLKVELLSFGRQQQQTPSQDDGEKTATIKDKDETLAPLKQRLTIGSYHVNVLQDDDTTYPLLEPFSYSAEVTRASGHERFGDLFTGMIVVGQPVASAVEAAIANESGGLVVHCGLVQLQAFSQLGVMLMAAPSPSDSGAGVTDTAETDAASASDANENGHVTSSMLSDEQPKQNSAPSTETNKSEAVIVSDASMFTFPFEFVSITFLDSTRISISNVETRYRADGTVMTVEAQKFLYEDLSVTQSQDEGTTLGISGIKASLQPHAVLQINEITTLFIPDVVDLTSPIKNPTVTYEGKTLSVNIETIEATLLAKQTVDSQNKEAVASTTGTTTISTRSSMAGSTSTKNQVDEENVSSRPSVPCPISMSLQDVKLKNACNGSVTRLQVLDMYLDPEHDSSSTDVGIRLGEFKNDLLYLYKTNLYAKLPLDRPHEVQAFNFAAESARVTAGYSADDWLETFQQSVDQRSKSQVLKFPFANIAPLKVVVAWTGTGVSVKDTSLSFRPFKGNANTTSKDLVNYYVGACMKHAPGFISNAQVLGLNVVDTAASTYSALLAPSLGPATGVAAIAAVDGVKGAVSAGKRGRNVDEGDRYKPGDVIRGLVVAAQETTQAGAVKRGKEGGQGNVADFAVGAGYGAAEYVSENKSRLGSASGGGVGVIVGTMLGGPVGGIVGGLVGTAITQKAIDSADKLESRSQSQRNKSKGNNA